MLGGYVRLSVTPLEFLIGPPRGISSIVVVMTDSPNLDLTALRGVTLATDRHRRSLAPA